jgi:hypothetical protein
MEEFKQCALDTESPHAAAPLDCFTSLIHLETTEGRRLSPMNVYLRTALSGYDWTGLGSAIIHFYEKALISTDSQVGIGGIRFRVRQGLCKGQCHLNIRAGKLPLAFGGFFCMALFFC